MGLTESLVEEGESNAWLIRHDDTDFTITNNIYFLTSLLAREGIMNKFYLEIPYLMPHY